MDFKNIRLRLSSDGYLVFGKKRYFHREIWKSFHGEIPKGYHIHHKDGNKLNNSIENLECLSHADHLRLHMRENAEKLHEWHKSAEGRAFLGEKAKQLWKDREIHTINCLQCGKTFEAKQVDRAKYCDNKCEQRARRARGDDLIDRICVICEQPFKVNRYYKTLTCGYKCGSKYRTRFAKGKRKSKKII